ncbi:hsp70-binding protein 1 isoform X2 [Chamaea fasciata]|uniref:hsp70-binding protein 1 isoform X2 n=1 Tax=Chamaea fasciata TaxID=190680 RepID=UPI00336A8311
MAAAEGGGAGGGRREPPHTLQGLLEMALVAGEAQPEPRQPMAEERQRWLRAAVTEALGSTGGSRAELQRCLRVLARPCPGEEAAERGPGDTGEHERALEELAELCESLDNATGLVRAQPEGLEQLEALGGLEVLGGVLQSPQPALRARAAFLLHCLLKEHPRLKGPLVGLGLVPRVVTLLRSEHDGAHEHGLGALCSLATDFPEGLRECRAPGLGLEELLRERRQLLRGHDEFQEELEFCERLLQLCFETPPRGIHHGPVTPKPPQIAPKIPPSLGGPRKTPQNPATPPMRGE